MTGIFPSNGVVPGDTNNSIPAPGVEPNCNPLWYGPRCNPRMDPFAMNAVIAEIINAVNATGVDYDCDSLSNLAVAMQSISSIYNVNADLEADVPSASVNAVIVSGYTNPGLGGGLYRRVGAEPVHAGKIQAADGSWWELMTTTPNVSMFGGSLAALQTYLQVGPSIEPIYASELSLGVDGAGNTRLRFWDDASNVYRSLRWNTATSRFEYEDRDGVFAPMGGIGVDQTWQTVTRSANTIYQNTTNRSIQVSISGSATTNFQVSQDGVSFLSIASASSGEHITSAIIPPGYYYRSAAAFNTWRELRD